MNSPVDDFRARSLETWPDHLLLAAYQRAYGEPGNAEADALLAEIKRRSLDV